MKFNILIYHGEMMHRIFCDIKIHIIETSLKKWTLLYPMSKCLSGCYITRLSLINSNSVGCKK